MEKKKKKSRGVDDSFICLLAIATIDRLSERGVPGIFIK